MGKENVSVDEMLQELTDWLDIGEKPLQDDGWFTRQDMMDASHSTFWKVRRKTEIGVKQGKLEKIIWSGTGYYRIRKDNT